MWLVYAAGSACCFGLRGILYQWTSKQPADRNVLLFGVYFCGALVALLLNGFIGQAWTAGAAAGILMGLFSFISNSAMHKGFSEGKASLVALLTGLPPIVVVFGAYFLWDERLNWGQAVAFSVIMCGGLLIKGAGGVSLRDMKGVQWGLLAMLTFALTDMSSKQASLWGGETLPTVAVMYITGSLLFGWRAWKAGVNPGKGHAAAIAPGRPAAHPELWTTRKTLLIGMAVGVTNISGMILIMPAFRLGVTGLVSAIIAMNVLLILLYARIVLKERFSPLELAGVTLAFGGVLALRVLG